MFTVIFIRSLKSPKQPSTMKINSSFTMFFVAKTTTATRKFFFAVLLAAGTVASSQAQGQLASGAISGSGSGPYSYSLTFSNASNATSSIGSVWYAWIPGFLSAGRSHQRSRAGWVDRNRFLATQFNSSPAPRPTTSPPEIRYPGFGYQASFSPAQLAAAANSGVSVAYSAGLFSDAGNTFTVQAAVVPEPTSSALLLFTGIVFIFVRRKIFPDRSTVKLCAVRHSPWTKM